MFLVKKIFCLIHPDQSPPQPPSPDSPSSLQLQTSHPVQLVISPTPAHLTPSGTGINCVCSPQFSHANYHMFPQDPDDVHPSRRLDEVLFKMALHFINLYAHQHVPPLG